jgi:hypothetical protein
MNAKAISLNGRIVEENGGGMECIHFLGPCMYNFSVVMKVICWKESQKFEGVQIAREGE